MRDVDQVFMEEIQRESYIRALTDDFSVVDLISGNGGISHEQEGNS